MSFLSLWNEVNNLGSYLTGGGGSKRKIILSCDGTRFVVPVTPKTYKVETEQNNRVVDILDTGEAQLFGNRKLKRLSFSCFFPQPKHEYPFVVGDTMEPTACVSLLEKWKEGKKAVRVIITDSPVNLMMSIKSFDYREQDGSRDIYYELKFIKISAVKRAKDILDASKKAYGKYKYWRTLKDKNNLKGLALKNLRNIIIKKGSQQS